MVRRRGVLMSEFNQYNPDEECKKVMARIEEICHIQGISQYELAKSAGISRSTIHDLLKGNNSPCLHTIYKICNALNLPIQALIDSSPHMDGKENSDKEYLLLYYQHLSAEKKELLATYMKMLAQYKE